MGNVCEKNHAPESCNIFDKLSPKGRLAIIHRKKLCQFCFSHPNNQPCTSQSQPACPVRGCMRMHHELLHDALQEEKIRAMVIEIQPNSSKDEDEADAAAYVGDYEQGDFDYDQENDQGEDG
jgi:hypothetical protein